MTLVFRPHLPLYLRQHPVYCSVHQASRSASSREFCLCLLSHHSSSMRFWGLELRSSRLHRKLFNLSLNEQARERVAFLGPLNVPINFRNNSSTCWKWRGLLQFDFTYQLEGSFVFYREISTVSFSSQMWNIFSFKFPVSTVSVLFHTVHLWPELSCCRSFIGFCLWIVVAKI